MAENVTLVADFVPDVKASADLRTHQFKLVQFDSTGVRLAIPDASSGGFWVLGNKPNSGEACQLVSHPNVTKTVCATIIPRNAFVGSVLSGGLVSPLTYSQVASGLAIGKAVTAAATGSGEIISVKVYW